MTRKVKNRTRNKWNLIPVSNEKNTQETHVKPNQSKSIREILFRNTAGMTYDNYKTPYYEDQATFSSQSLNVIQDMEPTEKLAFLSSLEKKTEDLKNKIQGFENEKQEALKKHQESIQHHMGKVEEDLKEMDSKPKE